LPDKAPQGLPPRQIRFCEEYLLDLNATAAYRRAGYKAKNDNVAAASACALLRNTKVQHAIQAAFKARSERTELTADWVIRGLRTEAEFRGSGSSPSARVRALELLGRHLGLFPDNRRVEVSASFEHQHQQTNRHLDVLRLLDDETQSKLLEAMEKAGAQQFDLNSLVPPDGTAGRIARPCGETTASGTTAPPERRGGV
jgi:hypothetical protein